VSEASDIISTAAHEEANIIFGAVIDQKMQGKIKVTVIATGFDRSRVATSPAAQQSIVTPSDMSAYTALKHSGDIRSVAGGGRVVLTRRPGIDLSALRPAAGIPMPLLAGDGPDDPSPLDTPAFLRRHEGSAGARASLIIRASDNGSSPPPPCLASGHARSAVHMCVDRGGAAAGISSGA